MPTPNKLLFSTKSYTECPLISFFGRHLYVTHFLVPPPRQESNKSILPIKITAGCIVQGSCKTVEGPILQKLNCLDIANFTLTAMVKFSIFAKLSAHKNSCGNKAPPKINFLYSSLTTLWYIWGSKHLWGVYRNHKPSKMRFITNRASSFIEGCRVVQ